MDVFLLALSITAALSNNLILHTFPLGYKRNNFLFNFICASVWLTIMFAVCHPPFFFTSNEILFGVLYGLTQSAFLLCKSGAMSSGPVSVTTFIGNCSLLISTLAGFLIWNEKISVPQFIGLILLCVSVFLCTYKNDGTSRKKKWWFFCIGFLASAAAVGILFKAFHKAGGGDRNRMMLIGSAVITVFLFFCGLFTDMFRKQTVLKKRSSFILIILCGFVGCLYNNLNIMLAGKLPGILFYPIFNGSVILLSALCGILGFGEETTPHSLIGIALGTLSIIIISVF